MADYTFEPLSERHAEGVMDVFNYFVRAGFAAYPERPLPCEFYGRLLELAKGYPAVAVVGERGVVVGFGLLHKYNPFSTFDRCAELSYFIAPDYMRQGIGGAMLELFIGEAKRMGVDTLLASVSSRNEESLRFHAKHGFKEVGRLERVGRKLGQDFDVVWMQRHL